MVIRPVYKFTDSREYLNYRRVKDDVTFRKLASKGSHMAYGHLADISRGNALMSNEIANKLAIAWGFDFDEFTYWRALVEYENTDDPRLQKFFKQMMRTVKASLI